MIRLRLHERLGRKRTGDGGTFEGPRSTLLRRTLKSVVFLFTG